MSLQEAELEQIGGYVRTHLGEWLVQAQGGWSPESYERDLRERMVRVEEELRHQRELMQQGFALMEKRFEQVDRRFEQVDRRFEEMDETDGPVHGRVVRAHRDGGRNGERRAEGVAVRSAVALGRRG